MVELIGNLPIYDREIQDPSVWARSTLLESDWRVPVTPACREEILQMVERIRKYPFPVLLRQPQQFELVHVRALMAQVRQILNRGVGQAVIDRLPLEEMDAEEAKTIVWVLAQLLGRLVPQKWDGTVIYDVQDKGYTYQVGVRASVTSVGLDFHTDAPFNDFAPETVILLCLYPAQEGGLSRSLSLTAVHNLLWQQHRSYLPRLYQPFYFDRQQEHSPEESRSRPYAIFSFQGRFQGRCNTTLIRNGYALAGEELDAPGEAALTALQQVLSDESLWWEGRLERGQIQFLNNYTLAHTRTAFQDGPDPIPKRHLVRYWVRNQGPAFFV